MPDQYGQSVTLARLYERTSAKGNTYLTGRLGLAKIAVLKSRETTDDGTQIWNIVIQEAPDSANGKRQKPERSPDTEAPIQTSPNPEPTHETPAEPAPFDKALDDEIPF
jgi:hypothetical protein